MARTMSRWTATVDIDGIDYNSHSVTLPVELDQSPGREVTATVPDYQVERLIRHLTAASESLRARRRRTTVHRPVRAYLAYS